jgi:hypothetical protein
MTERKRNLAARDASQRRPAGPFAASIGLLMLETGFPRPPGDIGNPETFDFPVIAERVPGASVRRAVDERAAGLIEPFVAAGRRLVERGAVAIATSCGFLVLHQRALAAALPVPVASSSLLQVPWVDALLGPGRRCGVLTFDAGSLGAEHLRAAGAPADTPVAGMPRDGALQRAIREDAARLDQRAVRREVLEVASALVRAEPSVGAIVLECTNLPPYAAELRGLLGLPVFDSTTLVEWLWRGAGKGSAARGAANASPASPRDP